MSVDFENSIQYADWRTPFSILAQRESDGQVDRIAQLAAERLTDLVTFAAKNPAAWETVMERMRDPRASYREIGKRLKIDKMTAFRHLSLACRSVPGLADAMLMNTRVRTKSGTVRAA